MVLPVLILLVGQLLNPPLALPQVLLGIAHPPVLSVQLGLQLPDAGVHLGHGLLAALQGVLLGIIEASLEVLDLGLKQLAVPVEGLGHLLLCAELIGEAGRVDHGLLGLLVGEAALVGHLIQVSLQMIKNY